MGDEFIDTLAGVIDEGFSHADDQLGNNATLADTPSIIANHVGALVLGNNTQDKRREIANSMLPMITVA